MFMCVRHPLDVFPSYASLNNTMSHGNKPEYEFNEEFPEWWAWWVKRQTVVMRDFFNIIRNDCYAQDKCPLYIVRYEDLVLKPKETLMGLFAYLLGVKDLTGTNTERRIDEVVVNPKAGQSYNLKSHTGRLNVHEEKYPPELRQYVQENLSELIHYFGYAKVDGVDNPTGFFEYQDESSSDRA